MVLSAEPIAQGKEPCSGLWLFIAPRFLPKRICSHSWKGRKEFGVPICVSRHFPGSPCFSDMLLGHGVHPHPLCGCPPGQFVFLSGRTVTPSFSPALLACPLDPPLHAPSANARGAHIACQTGEEGGEERARSPMFLPDTPLDGPGLVGAVTHAWQVTWGRAVGCAGAHCIFSRDLFPSEQRGLALSSRGERA